MGGERPQLQITSYELPGDLSLLAAGVAIRNLKFQILLTRD
jgi:hypothetical protein